MKGHTVDRPTLYPFIQDYLLLECKHGLITCANSKKNDIFQKYHFFAIFSYGSDHVYIPDVNYHSEMR